MSLFNGYSCNQHDMGVGGFVVSQLDPPLTRDEG